MPYIGAVYGRYNKGMAFSTIAFEDKNKFSTN